MLAAVPALPPRWRLLRADAADLPFEDESFDVVISAYLLHLLDVELRHRVVAEVRRVLGPRGRFVTVTPIAPASPLVRALLGPFVHRAASATLGGALRPLDPRPELEEAGFRILEAHPVRRGYPSLVVAARVP